MKKKLALCSALLSLAVLAGCGGGNGESAAPESSKPEAADSLSEPASTPELLRDVLEFDGAAILPEYAEVSELEIVKRQTNPEDKQDIVYVRLTGTEGGLTQNQYYAKLLYNYYDEGGWILDEMTPDSEDDWGVIGYLNGDGVAIEDAMIPLGSVSGELAINDLGQWSADGKVYDVNGGTVPGLTAVTATNRAICEEDGLFYLCDTDGVKLSEGYESLDYSFAVTDEDWHTVDHRWRVVRDGMLGFISDSGAVAIPLEYDAELNAEEGFPEPIQHELLILSSAGGGKNVVNADGLKLMFYGESEDFTVQLCGKNFVTGTDAGDSLVNIEAYSNSGERLFSASGYDVNCNYAGVACWQGNSMGWDLYNWQGESAHFDDGEDILYSLYPLFGSNLLSNRYYAMGSTGSGVYHITGPTNASARYEIDCTVSYLVYSSLILDASGAVYDLNGRVVIPATDGGWVTPAGGGVFIVMDGEGREALYDYNGNQRTQYFEDVYAHSENGAWFIVRDGGELYALESPLTEENLMFAPYYTNLFVPSGSLS